MPPIKPALAGLPTAGGSGSDGAHDRPWALVLGGALLVGALYCVTFRGRHASLRLRRCVQYMSAQAAAVAAAVSRLAAPAANPHFLDRQRQQVTLAHKETLTHDVRLFRFSLPDGMVLGLPTSQHIKLYAPNTDGCKPGHWNGKPDREAGRPEIERKYSPTTSDSDQGHFDLVLKIYERGVKDGFPDGGKMSQYIDGLQIGATVDVMGPVGRHAYRGDGILAIGRKEKKCAHIGLLAGGTGVTPMLQIVRSVLSNPRDKTRLSLLFANQTVDDIFLRDELEALQRAHPDQFHLWYTVDSPPAEGWTYSTGFINSEMINEHMPSPGNDTMILMCGPLPMIQFACKPGLLELGFTTDMMSSF